MTDPGLDAEAPAKRGRAEIRAIMLLVLAVLIGGGLYVFFFGSPNAENRARDSLTGDAPAGTLEPR